MKINKKSEDIKLKVRDSIFCFCVFFYIWYFLSVLLAPISSFLVLPDYFFIIFYEISSFSPFFILFVFCVSFLSSIIVLSEFEEYSYNMKLFFVQGVSLILYFLVPILSTLFILLSFFLKFDVAFPSEFDTSSFLGNIFFVSSILFLVTFLLNTASLMVLNMWCCKVRNKKI